MSQSKPKSDTISSGKKVPSSGRTLPWLIIAVLLTALWSFSSSFQTPSDAYFDLPLPGRISYMIALAVVPAVVVWLVLYFGFTRRLERHRGVAHFGILLVIGVLAAAPMSALKVMGEINGARTSVLIRNILQDQKTEALATGEALSRAQARILSSAPFSDSELGKAGGVVRARQAVLELRRLHAQAKDDAQQLSNRTRIRLSELPVSDNMRADLLRAHDMGKTESHEAPFEASAAMFNGLEAQLDILSRTPRGWRLEDGVIGFTNERDMNDYNAQAGLITAARQRLAEAGEAMDASEIPQP